MPMTFHGAHTFITMQGDTANVARGPIAAFESIKMLGLNGGGFFGANSAHPFENPNFFTNMIENIFHILLPIATVFALGFYLKRKKIIPYDFRRNDNWLSVIAYSNCLF